MHSSPENTLASCNHPIRAINGLDLLQTCTGLIYVSKNYCSTQIGKSWSNTKPKFWHMKVQILSEMTILPSYVASFSETISLRWPNQPQSFVKIPKSLPPSFSTFPPLFPILRSIPPAIAERQWRFQIWILLLFHPIPRSICYNSSSDPWAETSSRAAGDADISEAEALLWNLTSDDFIRIGIFLL